MDLASKIKAMRIGMGLKQNPFAALIGADQGSVSRWERGIVVPEPAHLIKIAKLAGVPYEEFLIPDLTPPLLQANPAQPFNPIPAPQPSELTQTIPVYGSAQGGNGDGWFELNGHAIDHVRCPPGLTGVKGAYSLRVQGISMEPRYFEGELVYVNPARSVTPGCFVVIQMKPSHDGDPIKAFIKQLVRRTAEKLVVHQYQPDSDYDIPAGDVLAIHRIMNGEELF